MASAAQVRANRANAQKSTGPRTDVGKERACQNAVRHGLLAQEAVIQGEDPEEFELYRVRMLAELTPAGAVETMLAERVVGLSWRLRRAERLQNAALAALDEGTPTPLLAAQLEEWKRLKGSEADRSVSGVVDESLAVGRVVVEDFAEARVLDRMLMYERRIESSLYRTMAELRKAQEARQARATVTPEEAARPDGRLQAGQESATAVKLASFGANAVAGGQTRRIAFGSPEPPAGSAGGMGGPPVVGNHGQDGDGAPNAIYRVCAKRSQFQVESQVGSARWHVDRANGKRSESSDFPLPTSDCRRTGIVPRRGAVVC